MNSFTPEDFDFTVLEEGSCACDVLEQRINESSMSDDKDAFYVADLGDILKKHLRWVRALPRVTPFYAIKCNDSRTVVMMLATLGTGFDCASKMMTFDSEAELPKIARYHENAKLVLRITTDDSKAVCRLSVKFGAALESSRLLLERARELGLDIIGVSFHVGSRCTDPETYSQAISDARCADMGAELGYNMTLLDIGGGFPGSDDSKLTFEEFTAVINPALDKYFPADSEVQVIAEPGRYYVTSAYTLAVNIIAKKVVIREQSACNGKADGANNGTLMYYVNEGVYSSFVHVIFNYAHVLATPHKKLKPGERTYPCSIWGQTCDGQDRIVEQCILPDLQVGEWLLFHNMGAYTIPMYCTFNGFQKPDIHYVMSRSVWQRIQQISTQGLHGPIEEACPSDLPSCCRRESSL
ncbi:hypothetical protein ANANG_G00003000 [Anguilla anguilla]|uniref:ornithine decarboxylase n=1 Tax=Anguilla anguilla TaxID=7936 RepID=A0A9D3MVF4_ANGAN|nr:hypothetical protein ANANG_G00003000 [Anguilla anguilla]